MFKPFSEYDYQNVDEYDQNFQLIMRNEITESTPDDGRMEQNEEALIYSGINIEVEKEAIENSEIALILDDSQRTTKDCLSESRTNLDICNSSNIIFNIEKDKERVEENKKRRGRDKKNEQKSYDPKRKTKFHEQNMTTKIKTRFFKNIFSVINAIQKYEEEKRGGNKCIYGVLKKLNGVIKRNTEIERTQKIIEKSFYDIIYTEEVESKYINKPDINKKILKHIKENATYYPMTYNFLQLTFGKVFEYFIGKNKDFLDELCDDEVCVNIAKKNFLLIDEECEKMKQKGESELYINAYKVRSEEFIQYYKNAKGRNSMKKWKKEHDREQLN